jgi:hypothetical protein
MLHDINMTAFLEFMFVSINCVQWCFHQYLDNSAMCKCYPSAFDRFNNSFTSALGARIVAFMPFALDLLHCCQCKLTKSYLIRNMGFLVLIPVNVEGYRLQYSRMWWFVVSYLDTNVSFALKMVVAIFLEYWWSTEVHGIISQKTTSRNKAAQSSFRHAVYFQSVYRCLYISLNNMWNVNFVKQFVLLVF